MRYINSLSLSLSLSLTAQGGDLPFFERGFNYEQNSIYSRTRLDGTAEQPFICGGLSAKKERKKCMK